jgi:hypothetical protein
MGYHIPEVSKGVLPLPYDTARREGPYSNLHYRDAHTLSTFSEDSNIAGADDEKKGDPTMCATIVWPDR